MYCLDSGVDLSYIVKAAPAASLNEEQEEQTHEILQVSLALLCKTCLLKKY